MRRWFIFFELFDFDEFMTAIYCLFLKTSSHIVRIIFEAYCKILVSFVVNLIICTVWKDFLVKNFESDCKMLHFTLEIILTLCAVP